MASWKQRQLLAEGSRAPDFELRDPDGATVSLQQALARGPALVGFFKITCPVCQLTFPFLERLHQAGGPVQFLGISQDDARDTREFKQEYGVTFPALLDTRGYPVSNAYGISVVPALFLVEPDGKISWTLEGFSKTELEALGQRAGSSPFRPGERVPDWKGG